MISNKPSQCFSCANLIRERGGFLRCKAFPHGIPEELSKTVVSHTKPYPGDRGILWSKYTGSLDLDGVPIGGELTEKI